MKPWEIVLLGNAVLLFAAAVLGGLLHRARPCTVLGLGTLALGLVAAWLFERELWPWDILSAAVTLLAAFVWLNAGPSEPSEPSRREA